MTTTNWLNPNPFGLSGNPAGVDQHAATELELYMDNDTRFASGSPSGMGRNVAKNMANKIRKGRYDPELAVKGWMHVVDAAAKAYVREFGGGTWHQIFSKQTRLVVARRQAEQFKRDFDAGEYASL